MSAPVKRNPPLRLGRGRFCLADLNEFASVLQAWTVHDLGEALRHPDFLLDMQGNCRPGDTIELFQVCREDLDVPERDPLAMQTLIVKGLQNTPHGMRMLTVPIASLLRFSNASGKGVEVARWNGLYRVWRDGERAASFETRVQAVEHAEMLRDPSGWEARANAILKKPEPSPSRDELRTRCRQEDIGLDGNRKISRVLTLRTLEPITDVLTHPQYFARAASRFRATDRLSITRFASDAYDAVVEILPLALVDVDRGRVRLYPQGKILTTGKAAEAGYVLHNEGREFVMRRDGLTLDRFHDRQRADWWMEANGVTARMAA